MMFDQIGKALTPGWIRKHIRRYLSKTGKNKVPYSLYGSLFIISLLVSVAAYALIIFPALSDRHPVFLSISSFLILTLTELVLLALIIIGVYLSYEFTIFRRTTRIEEVLPDFLQEVAVNLRSGMSFDKALWNSVEPEFGVLEKEIEIVAKKVMAGEDTEDALKEFAEKYNSVLLQESMDMLIVGIKSGGNIADLIDKIVENVKNAYFLKKELIASVTSYVIFITITAVIISPTLFALSFNLMEIIQGLGEKLSSTASYDIIPISLGKKAIDPDSFILFSKISVVIIAGISSIIIADLREGSIKAGIKYILLFAPIAYGLYMLMLNLFVGIFGVLI